MSELNPARAAIVRPLEKQRRMTAYGVGVTILLSAAESGGAQSIIEYISPPTGLGPPLHYHQKMEESFHLVEGELNFQVGDERIVAGPGTFLHVPAGVVHAFWNSSGKPARFIGTMTPGGFENFLIDLFELAKQHPTMTNDIRPLVAKLGGKYDQVIVGPSPGIPKAQ